MSQFFEKPALSEAEKHHNSYGDIMTPFCLHKCWFCLYRVRINVNFLQKYKYFRKSLM